MLTSNSKNARRLNSVILLFGIAEVLALAAMVGALPENSEGQHVRRLLRVSERVTDDTDGAAFPRMVENSTDGQRTANPCPTCSIAPSVRCQQVHNAVGGSADNVVFNYDCEQYIAVRPSDKKSPCAFFEEAMTGSSVQTTYKLALAFNEAPRSMKFKIDDGPADTSITKIQETWSAEAIFDTDGDNAQTAKTLIDFEDETTHSNYFTTYLRDATLDANTKIEVICH